MEALAMDIVKKSAALAALMAEFVVETLIGYEAGWFRSPKLRPYLRGGAENTPMGIALRNLFVQSHVHYFNRLHLSLIKGDDPYVVQKFREMTSISGHSEVCLLLILNQCCRGLFQCIDRKQLPISPNLGDVKELQAGRSLDKYVYTENVREQLEGPRLLLILVLSKTMSHKCTGIDIRKCDPKIPLFYTTRHAQELS